MVLGMSLSTFTRVHIDQPGWSRLRIRRPVRPAECETAQRMDRDLSNHDGAEQRDRISVSG